MDDLEDELNEILESNGIKDYEPLCMHCKFWKELEHSTIGQCHNSKFVITPVYIRGNSFFCSEFYYDEKRK